MKSEKVKDAVFRFKEFTVSNRDSAMKVGTDGVLLGAWALLDLEIIPRWIVDAGTGTGIIALLMAQRFADAVITGIEIDGTASEEASLNFRNSRWGQRLKCINKPFEDFCKSEIDLRGKIDLLISNPPFFRNDKNVTSDTRTLARQEGSLSPVALIRLAPTLLTHYGRLCFISTEQSRSVIEFEAALAGLILERRTAVATGEGKTPRRILWQFAMKSAGAMLKTDDILTIRWRGGTPSPEYQKLVEPYYLYVK